jgi:hypothetical protein
MGCSNKNRQPSPHTPAEQMPRRVVRLAELEIAFEQLENGFVARMLLSQVSG